MENYPRHIVQYLTCLLLIADNVLAQQQSTTADPCKLYDLNTGAILATKQFEVVIQETDNVADPFQVVYAPISGGSSIFLVGETQGDIDTLNLYGISFGFNNGFIEMSVSESIDRDGVDYQNNDDLDVIQFNLECQFTVSGQSALDYFGVTARITDANDNPPVFRGLPYNVAIKEALPISTTVFDTISATDRDANINKEIQYAITSGAAYGGNTYFNMPDPGLGYIMLSRTLDYEFLDQNNAKQFLVTVTARDNAANFANRRTSTTTVTITIEDSDDLTPTFYHTGCRDTSTLLDSCDGVIYRAAITSGTVAAGTITVVPIVSGTETTAANLRAFDMDKLNAAVTFDIIGTVPSGYENRFSVSTSGPVTDAALPGRNIYTASLSQNSAVTRSEAKTLTLFLKASQVNDPQKYRIAEIEFSVEPNNQNNPTIRTSTGANVGYIEENVAVGTNVRESATGTPSLQLIVEDVDIVAGDTQGYRYEIISGAAVPFAVQHSGGDRATIYATGPLDRETTPTYSFTARVTEDITGGRSADLPLTVQIQDVNDNTPTFTGSGYIRNILQGNYSGANRLLLSDVIRATDQDSGDNGRVSYSIKDVRVTSGTLTDAQVLSILSIESNGNVYLNGAVSRGLAFVATIRATDNAARAPRSSVESLTVTVSDDGNNAPAFRSSSFTVEESEGSPGGSFVLAVEATDLEDTTLTYSISTPYITGTSNKFTISGTTEGTIRVAGAATSYPLDYETEPQYVFIVRAQDSTGRTGTTTVTVLITNINDNAPTFGSQSYTFNVDEGLANTPVGTVSASDGDGNSFTFSLVGTTAFSINQNTGQIGTLNALDYEVRNQYIFIARVVDSGNPPLTSQVQVTVNVNDLNDNIPLFVDQIYNGYVLEGQNGVPILQTGSGTNLAVSATDADSVRQVSYRFQIEPNNDFNLDPSTGALTTKRALDYEAQSSYSFYVTTVDGATTAQNSPNSGARALVQITVIDVNDNSPVISAATTTVNILEDFVEYSASQNQLAQLNFGISGIDADAPNTANSRISYSIASVTPISAQNKFVIYSGTSIVTVVLTLTDVSGPITLRIQGTDGGTPLRLDNNNLQVTVNIIRNQAPTIQPTSNTAITIDDVANVNSVIYSFNATDPDTGRFGTLTYALTAETSALSYFTFSRNVFTTRQIDVSLSASITTTSANSYILTFRFTDDGYGAAQRSAGFVLTVNVRRNRNAPTWLATPSSPVVVSENLFLGDPIATIKVQDLDLRAPNNLMECNVIADAVALDYFRTETDNTNDFCYVYMKRSPALDRNVDTFNVRLSLTDRGEPTPLSAPNLDLVFNINRNDQPPIFFDLIDGVYRAQINERAAVGTTVRTVSATDSDPEPAFNQISYTIIGDDTAPTLFAIRDDVVSETDVGVVTVNGDLSTEATLEYIVRIVAKDNALVPRSATALLIVTVIRNFEAPQFDLASRSMSVTIAEDQELGMQISQLSGSDADTQPPNNVVNFRFRSGSAGQDYFDVDPSTGVVSVKKDLQADATRAGTYVLTFEIFDLGTPHLIGSITATVTVTVIRNQAPFFTDPNKFAVVDENMQSPYNIASFGYNDLDESNGLGGKFAQLSFRIRYPSAATNFFTMSNNAATKTLTVQTTRSLLEPNNANRINTWNLLLEVEDDGGLRGEATLQITINRNLYPPVMSSATLSAEILENIAEGTQVGPAVSATDQDSTSPYNQPSYVMVSSSAKATTYFNIEASTGRMFVRRRLSGISTTDTTYTFQIGARDGGDIPRSSTTQTQYTITVLRNLETPVMNPSYVEIPVSKNEVAGTTVYSFTATDADDPVKRFAFQDLTYRIVSGLGASMFTVDTVTNGVGQKVGNVRLTGNLNTGLSEYDLMVSACDGGDLPKCDYSTLKITVDSNLFPPTITEPSGANNYRHTATIREDISSSAIVYQLAASDSDTTSPFRDVSFEFVSSTSAAALDQFVINSQGVISIRKSLLGVAQSNFTVYVQAVDGGGRRSANTAIVTILVLRNEFAPQFINSPRTSYPYSTTISYLTTASTTVVTVLAVDNRDVFNVVSYEFRTNALFDQYFDINRNTGDIRLVGNLQDAVVSSIEKFDIGVIALDNGSPPLTNETVVVISVNRNNYPPVFVNDSLNNRISEETLPGTVVQRVNATDRDQIGPYNKVSYTLTGNVKAQQFFTVDRDTGEVIVRADLRGDVDKTQNYDLRVIAIDGGGLTSATSATVIINIYRNNNDPFFTGATSITVNENIDVGTSVYTFTYSDSDIDRPFGSQDLTIDTLGDCQAPEYFSLNTANGTLRVNKSLAYQPLDRFYYRVVARDGGSPPRSGTAVLTININQFFNGTPPTTVTSVPVSGGDWDDLTPTFYHTGCRDTSSLIDSCDSVKYRATAFSGTKIIGIIPVIPVVSGLETDIASIQAFDMDKLNARILFEIIGSIPLGFENRFSVTTSGPFTDDTLPGREIYTASLTQNTAINRSEATTVTLLLKARQANNEEKYRVADIELTIVESDQDISTETNNICEEAKSQGQRLTRKLGLPHLILLFLLQLLYNLYFQFN